MTIVPLARWPDYFPRARRVRVQRGGWWGGHGRKLTLDEQIEVQRRLRRGEATAAHLAERYGVSKRTIFRYANLARENLSGDRARILLWARERDLRLTRDDVETLLVALDRVAPPTAGR